jgi:hypothetical protein
MQWTSLLFSLWCILTSPLPSEWSRLLGLFSPCSLYLIDDFPDLLQPASHGVSK